MPLCWLGVKVVRQIDPSLISVVIQGPLYRDLAPQRGVEACIASIRHHLPGAEVIVSTWRSEDISGVDADHVVQSEDPGSMRDCSGNPLNTNRQLVSTLAGLEVSTRPYVMKFRSDHCLTSPDLASIGEYEGTPAHGRLFTTPITITTLFIRDPALCPMNFHVSDLVQFGARDDMLFFWQHPLFAYSDIFNSKPNLNPFGNFIGFSALKMSPEQAFMICVLRKHGFDVSLSHPCEIKTPDLELWESVLCSDFRTIDWKTAGVDFPERFQTFRIGIDTVISIATIRKLAGLSPIKRRVRRAKIWANQYIFNCFRPYWWLSLASIALFATSPSLAIKARRVWRKVMKIQHPSPERA